VNFAGARIQQGHHVSQIEISQALSETNTYQGGFWHFQSLHSFGEVRHCQIHKIESVLNLNAEALEIDLIVV
jgi:hypothetical protein